MVFVQKYLFGYFLKGFGGNMLDGKMSEGTESSSSESGTLSPVTPILSEVRIFE